jgi:hypothetical protein
MGWYPAACPACSGDLHDDPMDQNWVPCMMCAREYPAADVLAVQRLRKLHEYKRELEPAA